MLENRRSSKVESQQPLYNDGTIRIVIGNFYGYESAWADTGIKLLEAMLQFFS